MRRKHSIKPPVSAGTLVVGIDIAKHIHWVQMMHNGDLIGKAFSVHNNKEAFENLEKKVNACKNQLGAPKVMLGMEPTGHYFKPLAYFLKESQVGEVVLVNPFHVNRSKEFDDNSPSKNDRKDARLIAKLVSQGNYFEANLQYDVWAELRTGNVGRMQLIKKRWQLKNQLTTILDQYFPEFTSVFKDVLGKGARYILSHYPFPEDILSVDEQTLCQGLKEATHNRVGQKRAQKLREASMTSIGVREGLRGARIQIAHLVEEQELLQQQLGRTEALMASQLEQAGLDEYLTSIPGVGIITAAAFLAEIGNPDRYDNYKQIQKKAGLNLKENSSGQHKGKTTISKRGRPTLRQLMYQLAFVAVARNREMKAFYEQLIHRRENPLVSKQALIAVSVKMMKVMLAVCKKREYYNGDRVGKQFSAAEKHAA